MRARLSVLSQDEIETIHAATLEVLARVGVSVREPRALRLLTSSGAGREPGTDRVRIPETLVMEAVRGLPKRWTWHARDPSKTFTVGDGSRTRLGPGSSCTKLVDYKTGRPRVPTERDGDDLVRLMDALAYVDINYTPVSYGASEEPSGYREVEILVRDLQNTSKVMVGPSYDGAMAKQGLEIAKLLAGGEDALRKRPMLAGYCDPISPLTHDRMMTETLLEYARMGQPVFVMCLDLAGASSPASLAGTLVQQNAEILSGALIAFLANPKAPVVYGCVSGTMDMKAGSAAVGGPEFGLMGVASAQLAHSYGLPCSTGGQSDARIHDAQAAFEKGTTLLASMLAGADFVDLYFGSYEGFNATSPEQVVIDHEIAGYTHRYAEGIRIDGEALSLDLIEAVGPGGSYLKNPRSLRDTMKRMSTDWYLPRLFTRGGGDGADVSSSKSLLEAAHEAAVSILREHAPVPLDPAVLKEARAILRRMRKTRPRGDSST
ncbi:MAG TPA: trimethylamine methyltransferase family protein [Thermoplasmata archaeon]|nr:trimethylamine methyltransferase family protein [Thermoplasmata archaeon]